MGKEKEKMRMQFVRSLKELIQPFKRASSESCCGVHSSLLLFIKVSVSPKLLSLTHSFYILLCLFLFGLKKLRNKWN